MESHDAEFSEAGKTGPLPYMRKAAITFEGSSMKVELPDGFGTVYITGNLIETRYRDPNRACVGIDYRPPVSPGTVDEDGFHYEYTHSEFQKDRITVRRRHYEDRRDI